MRKLTKSEDPTGFLRMFRIVAADSFGDPSGRIQGRGCWHNPTKKGPGRFNEHDGRGLFNGNKCFRGNLGLRRGR